MKRYSYGEFKLHEKTFKPDSCNRQGRLFLVRISVKNYYSREIMLYV